MGRIGTRYLEAHAPPRTVRHYDYDNRMRPRHQRSLEYSLYAAIGRLLDKGELMWDEQSDNLVVTAKGQETVAQLERRWFWAGWPR